MDVINILQEHREHLSRTQKRIADYILTNFETACFLSLRDLASEAETTEATVVKFSKTLGFKSFMDFKKSMQSDVRDMLSPNERVKAAISAVPNTPNIYKRFWDQELQNLTSTFEMQQYEDIQQAASLLRGAHRVYVVGHEVTETVADFMVFRIRQLGFYVEKLDITDLNSVSLSTALSVDEDMFVLISLPVYCDETVALAHYLSMRGRRFIAITDSTKSSIAEGAQVILTCSNEDTVFYNSVTSAIVVVNMVCSLLAMDIREKFDQYKDRYNETVRTLAECIADQKKIKI